MEYRCFGKVLTVRGRENAYADRITNTHSSPKGVCQYQVNKHRWLMTHVAVTIDCRSLVLKSEAVALEDSAHYIASSGHLSRTFVQGSDLLRFTVEAEVFAQAWHRRQPT